MVPTSSPAVSNYPILLSTRSSVWGTVMCVWNRWYRRVH